MKIILPNKTTIFKSVRLVEPATIDRTSSTN